MKELVSEKEYDDYLKKYLYSSPIRFCITSTIMYFIITTVINIIFYGLEEVMNPHELRLQLINSVIWALIYTAIFLPIMKKMMKSTIRRDKVLKQEPNAYESYIKCSYNKSLLVSPTGTLFIGKDVLDFKSDSGIGKDITINRNNKLVVTVEKSKLGLINGALFKNLPDTLTIIDNDKSYKFYVPFPERLVEVITESRA